MKPAIEAFLRDDIIWNIMKGIRIVSDNQPVPVNPNSTERMTVSINTQAKMVFKTLTALYVLNPSLLIPAQSPKNPSNKTTAITARYCSVLSAVKFIKYEPINAPTVLSAVIIVIQVDLNKYILVSIIYFISELVINVYVNELLQIVAALFTTSINLSKSAFAAIT